MIPPVVILAGGLGTRLYPETRKVPKSLVEVAGKPFISHQLSLLRSQGVSEVLLCVGNLGEQIEAYVKDGSEWGLKVGYSYDGGALLGTGGALKKAAAKLPGRFLVLYGDSYLDTDLEPIIARFEAEGKPALMTLYRNRNEICGSNVLFRDGKIVRYDKKNPLPEMEHIDYGLSVLTKGVFDGRPEGAPFDLAEVFTELIGQGKMAAFEVGTRFHETGSFSGIKETEEYMLRKRQGRS
jgi:NDP-sugar pyrophosphorylase family protein